MEAAVWEPWSRQGEREGWGIHVHGNRLMRMKWADDHILVARDDATMRRMWSEATRLINEADFTVDASDDEKCSVWNHIGAQQRHEASKRSRSWARPSDAAQTTRQRKPEVKQQRKHDKGTERCCRGGRDRRGNSTTGRVGTDVALRVPQTGATEKTIQSYLVYWRRVTGTTLRIDW